MMVKWFASEGAFIWFEKLRAYAHYVIRPASADNDVYLCAKIGPALKAWAVGRRVLDICDDWRLKM